MRCLQPLLFALSFSVAVAWADEQPKDEPDTPAEEPEAAVLPGKITLALEPGGHTGFITRVLFTPDGKYLLTSASDNTIRIWDGHTGHSLRVLRHPGGGGVFALSADGRTLAVSFGYRDEGKITYAIALMVLEDGRIERVLRGHTVGIRSLAFSPDGKRLASSAGDKTIRLWNLASKDDPEQVIQTDKVVFGLAFSPDGKQLIEARENESPAIRNLADDKTVPLRGGKGAGGNHLKAKHWWGPTTVAWSPDGKTIATGSEEGLWLWEPDGKLRHHLLAGNWAVSVAFSADSRRVLATSWSNPAKASLFNVRTGKELRQRDQHYPHLGVLSPDGTLAATAGDQRGGTSEVVLWQTANGKIVKKMAAPARFAWQNVHLGWSADGKSITWKKAKNAENFKGAFAGFDLGELEFRDAPLVGSEFRGAVLQQGAFTLKPSNEKRVEILKDGKPLKLKFPAGKHPTSGFNHTLFGKDRAAITCHHNLILMDLTTRSVIREIHHPGGVRSVAPSPDGRYLLTLAGDQVLRIWDPDREGRPLLLSLALFRQDWILWTPEGFYAASPGGEKLMGWVIDNGISQCPSFYPAERFRRQLYRPDVLKLILEKGSTEEAIKVANVGRGTQTMGQVKIDELLPPRASLMVLDQSKLPSIKLKAQAMESSKGQPITALRLLMDGRPLPEGAAQEKFENGKKQATAEWTITLPPGKHQLSVLARCPDSSSISPSIEVSVADPGKQNSLHVLAVGINEYEDSSLKLEFAAKDAQDLAAAFQKCCKGELFQDVHSEVLVNAKARKEAVLEQLALMRKKVKPNDLVVVYFAGHGVKEKDKFYLLTVEAQLKDLAKTVLSGEELRKSLGEFPCQVLLMLDACHSSGSLKNFRPVVDDITRDLTDDECGVAVLCAAMAHEKALEKGGNGLFTKAVMDGLNRSEGVPFNTTNRLFYVHHLHSYVFDRVTDQSEGKQHPFLSLPWVVESFPVAKFEAK